MNYAELPCFACGKAFPPGSGADFLYGGVIFRAHGNYGSRVYDTPASREGYLAAAICDACLTQAGRRGRVMECCPERAVPVPVRKQKWEPGKEI